MSKELDLPDPAPIKDRFHTPRISVDDRYRLCGVVVEKLSDGRLRPQNITFQARKKAGRDSETFRAKTTLEGKLLKAYIQHGKVDEKGAGIAGSAVVAHLDPDSAMAQQLIRRELDFWLYGIGRKKPEPAAKPLDGTESKPKSAEPSAGPASGPASTPKPAPGNVNPPTPSPTPLPADTSRR